jgi:Conserved in the green lineage and diatoms 27
MRNSYTSVCPVPTEQQPIQEYQSLSESCFFSACAGGWSKYISVLVWFWLPSWLVAGPVAAASFSPSKHLLQFFLCCSAAATLVVVLVLLRWSLGWQYIRDRLNSRTIFYEESGWYDGQSWEKTPEILSRDRLIVTHQVQPILSRLQQTWVGVGALYAIGALAWVLLP